MAQIECDRAVYLLQGQGRKRDLDGFGRLTITESVHNRVQRHTRALYSVRTLLF